MSNSISTRNAAAPCGCSGGTVGSPLVTTCSCGNAGCVACSNQGYVRPRFFAGQLLTEDDLQALSDYVIEKNRLHNRHFMGDGVVCGLQVTCNPCGGAKLIVQPGHALDCCGNDLVLECAVELDAIAMVRDLRLKQRGGADCGDPCTERAANGDKLNPAQASRIVRHYCLYIRYYEEATDPVAPYTTDEPCGTSACEATRIREGVRFELRCRDEMGPSDGFLQRVVGCLQDLAKAEALTKALQQLFVKGATPDDVVAAREALLDQLDSTAQLTDCRLRGDVAAIAVPAPKGDVAPAAEKLLLAYIRLLRDCVCRALLPPCPACDDPGVLLACFSMADCEVLDICNLERKFVLTAPNFRYWFSVNLFGDLIERLCCTEIRLNSGHKISGPKSPSAGVAATQPVMTKMGTDKDTAALKNMVSDHLLKTFGLTERNGTQLSNIAANMGDIFSSGAFDDLLPARVLRHAIGGKDVSTVLSDELVDSAAFTKVTAELERQNTAKLEAARKQLQAENAKSAEAMAKQNIELRSQMGALMERLNKLEGKSAPALKPSLTNTKLARK